MNHFEKDVSMPAMCGCALSASLRTLWQWSINLVLASI